VGTSLHTRCCCCCCCCCQVEELRCPSLAGRPVAIQQHQDVIAVNYLARQAGVKKHMTPAQVRQQCDSIAVCMPACAGGLYSCAGGSRVRFGSVAAVATYTVPAQVRCSCWLCITCVIAPASRHPQPLLLSRLTGRQ
jgi:hypothetical protein